MTSMARLEVEAAGLLTTVQDLGRPGRQRDGLPVGGVMDLFAASAANLLLGNRRGAAVLEITLVGPAGRFPASTQIALCGGDLSARLDGAPLPLWRATTVQAGQRLTFGRRVSGARAYLAVGGGWDVPEAVGSRALRPGDLLRGFTQDGFPGERGLRPVDVPAYGLPAVLRVLPGPHPSQFTEHSQAELAEAIYTLSPQSDRQGYRLTGPAVSRRSAADLLSEPMPLGGIQIPPDGQPILLMADRQTTGGYPLIGVVISADIPRAGQLAPGDLIRFIPVSLPEAAAAALSAERFLRLLELAGSSARQSPAAAH